MKKFLAVMLLTLLSQSSFASEGWSASPEPYNPYGPNQTSNVWFNCGGIQNVAANLQVLNDYTLIVTWLNGAVQRLPMRSASGGFFSSNYTTYGGEYAGVFVLKARLSGPRIEAYGQTAYCSGGSSSGGSGADPGGGSWAP